MFKLEKHLSAAFSKPSGTPRVPWMKGILMEPLVLHRNLGEPFPQKTSFRGTWLLVEPQPFRQSQSSTDELVSPSSHLSCFPFNHNTKHNNTFKTHNHILPPISHAVAYCTLPRLSLTHTHTWVSPAITMPFTLIGRSYCWESKPAIISAALSEWDWLVSPSLWYGEERVYITLWALSLLQALTAVCLYRGSLSRFMSVTHLHARMKACNPAHGHSILFPRRVCTYTDRLVNILLRTCTPACILTCAMWNTVWFLSWLIPLPSFIHLSPSLALAPVQLSSFPLILALLPLPYTLSSPHLVLRGPCI